MQSRKEKEIYFTIEHYLLIVGFFSLIMDKKSWAKPSRLISVLQLHRKGWCVCFWVGLFAKNPEKERVSRLYMSAKSSHW